jgi:phytoene synthase
MRRAFQEAYPESASGFGRVFDLHERTSELIRRLFTPDRVPYVRDESALALSRWVGQALAPPAGSPALVPSHLRDLRTLLLDDFTGWYERQLPPSGPRDLLSRCGYTRMNVFVASAFWHLWAHDYWYPEGGLQPWIDRWVERLRERGVRFLFKRTVASVEKRGDRATAVVTQRGERFEAREVVYCGDYRQGVHRLVGAERYGARDLARLDATRHSDAMVSVYLGLDVAREELRERLRASHVFFFPSFDCRTALDPGDPDAHRKTFLEVTAHGVGGDVGDVPGARSAVVLQAFTRHDWLEGWGTGLTGDPAREATSLPRSAAYRSRKRAVADQLIASFEQLVPGATRRIVYRDVGAPQSAVRFTRNAFGGTCGFELNWRNFPFLNPLAHVTTPLENFHMAGHFTVWPGAVPTAALSGKIAALRADEGLRARHRAGRNGTGDANTAGGRAVLASRAATGGGMRTMTEAPTDGLTPAALERGWAECWRILREHGKTFHLMARVLGHERGDAIAALYGFARVADDAVDEPGPADTPESIRVQLRWMQDELRRAVAGESREPRFAVLGETIRRYQIPLQPFDDLVAGLLTDLGPLRCATFAELELYCYRVAGTVGLMITPVAGYRAGSRALEHAKTLGTAMQLTNILRDVGEDLRRDRIYIPQEDLARFDVTEADLVAGRIDSKFRALMDFEIARARRLYDEGVALIPLLTSARGRAAFEFAVEAYSGILAKIRKSDYDVFGKRAHLSFAEKLALLPSSAWHAWTAGVANGAGGRA